MHGVEKVGRESFFSLCHSSRPLEEMTQWQIRNIQKGPFLYSFAQLFAKCGDGHQHRQLQKRIGQFPGSKASSHLCCSDVVGLRMPAAERVRREVLLLILCLPLCDRGGWSRWAFLGGRLLSRRRCALANICHSCLNVVVQNMLSIFKCEDAWYKWAVLNLRNCRVTMQNISGPGIRLHTSAQQPISFPSLRY